MVEGKMRRGMLGGEDLWIGLKKEKNNWRGRGEEKRRRGGRESRKWCVSKVIQPMAVHSIPVSG